MIDPTSGPFLFDTSAESWLARDRRPAVRNWFAAYLAVHGVSVSAVTVIERIRGYALLWHRASATARAEVDAARVAYLGMPLVVLPVDHGIAVVSGEIMALCPDPPTPPRRSHGSVETRRDRLARWRFDTMVAATALAHGLQLLQNNDRDFEVIREAIEAHAERFPAMGPLRLVPCATLL